MRIGTASQRELRDEDLRLNAGLYLAEDALAWSTLTRSGLPTTPLGKLVKPGGLFRGPIFRRVYAAGPEQGRPYLSPDDIGAADIRPTSWLSESLGPLLDELTLREGMILVTCSGMNLGRAYWADGRLANMVASHDLIRVDIDPDQAPPGYVYAFLASKYGKIAIRRHIFGGSIKHVEPGQLASVEVPRLRSSELEIDALVRRSAAHLNKYYELMNHATSMVEKLCRIGPLSPTEWQKSAAHLGWAQYGVSSISLRALNFDPRAGRLSRIVSAGRHDPLGSLCEPRWFKGKCVFTRVPAAPEHGVMLVGQRQAFHTQPSGRWISRSSIEGLGLQVPYGTTLIPSHGTLGEGELYCRAVFVTHQLSESAFSGDFFRCVPISGKVHPGYLYAWLRSDVAFRLLRAISCGGKQQEQNAEMMWNLPVPRLDANHEEEIGKQVEEAGRHIDAANSRQEEAQQLLIRAFEGSA